MTAIAQNSVRNLLLRSMNPDDYLLLRPHLARVPHEKGQQVGAPGATIDRVRFPEGGVTAFLDASGEGTRIAVGLIGYEGVIEWPLLLGSDRWAHEAVVRGAGASALSIDAAALFEACARSRTLQERLLRFANTFMVQMGRTIMSNLIHPLERRLARWLLLYHDRLDSDVIMLTHEEMRIMLGIRRASATDSLHILEGERAIRNVRGRITIRDRNRLEAIAGDTYGYAEAEYRRLIGPFGRTA